MWENLRLSWLWTLARGQNYDISLQVASRGSNRTLETREESKMSAILTGLAFVALAGVITYAVYLGWRRLAFWWRMRQAGSFDQCWCGVQTTRKTVHRIFEVQDDSDLVEKTQEGQTAFRAHRGEGTAVSADLCAEHCTGHCNRGCPIREIPLPWKKQETR
jgi:fatty acid desaturase